MRIFVAVGRDIIGVTSFVVLMASAVAPAAVWEVLS